MYCSTGAGIIVRGAVGDLLFGGMTIVGDSSADTFAFNATLDAATNVDRVSRFKATAHDRMAPDPIVFAAVVGSGIAGLGAGEFLVNAGGNAVGAVDFILFDSATGSLYYDADGSGAGSKTLFATLGGLIGTIDHADLGTNSLIGV